MQGTISQYKLLLSAEVQADIFFPLSRQIILVQYETLICSASIELATHQ